MISCLRLFCYFPQPSPQKSSYLISMLYTACFLSAGKIQSTKNVYCFESNNKMCACLQISYHCFFPAETERNREVKFHVVMYKIVFQEGHGELAVLILIGLMQLNPSPLLIKHKRYEIRNLIMKHKLNQHRLLQRAQIYFISLGNNKPHWHLDRNEACLLEHMSSS